MTLEELQKRRQQLRAETENNLHNMDVIIKESQRVSEVAHNAREILDNLDAEFERQTGLKGQDIAFLFVATALQCARIYLINNLTKIEKAGSARNEHELHKFQNKVFDKFEDWKHNANDIRSSAHEYYAPIDQIITIYGVPYDSTQYVGENFDLFKGGNHRYSTLGHDPVLGLIFGTANILTNSITCAKSPIITTNHVVYDQSIIKDVAKYKSPKIGAPCSTLYMLNEAIKRVDGDMPAVIAAIIKQIIHIGTDMYTPCGIHLPGANLVLSAENVEKLTKHVSTGDVLKVGASAGLATLINTIISTVHMLLYDETKYASPDIYSVKTRKIIMYSNTIASTSNVIWVGANMAVGNESAIKDLDIGGLIVTIHRLLTDVKFIQQVKEEFIFGSFNKMIQGEPLELK